MDDIQRERFWAKVEKTDSCWIWVGARSGSGYGNFHIRPRNYNAHRLAYEDLVGPIPEGLQLDHLCRNRACVNPAHLEPVTCKENLNRGLKGRREACSQGHPLEGEGTDRRCPTCRKNRRRERYSSDSEYRERVKRQSLETYYRQKEKVT